MTEDIKHLTHYQLVALKQKQKEAQDNKYLDRSKKRLTNIITKKIQTSFIGAIAAVEEGLGFLWGHGKSPDELTDEERQMTELWNVVRAKILDNGNGQLRGAMNELNYNSVHWDRYHMELPVKEQGEQNE
jgi:hypothetical protein